MKCPHCNEDFEDEDVLNAHLREEEIFLHETEKLMRQRVTCKITMTVFPDLDNKEEQLQIDYLIPPTIYTSSMVESTILDIQKMLFSRLLISYGKWRKENPRLQDCLKCKGVGYLCKHERNPDESCGYCSESYTCTLCEGVGKHGY